MQDEPIDEKIILDELSEIHKLDYNYSDGRILGSMCTEAHPFAKEVYCKFLDTNLGDPGLFKGTKLIEEKVIASIGDLLSLDNAYGNIVTGGTEANLMAIRAARNHARKYKGIVDGEIIIPSSAHFSFKKAADMLNLKIVEAELDDDYKIDVESVKNSISDNDAAFGGFSIPFLKEAGYDLPVFDFSLEGVCSITVDPHKMGLAPIPAGGIIFRKEEYLQVMAVDSPYLTVKTQSTIVGTRLGASSAATYAIMKYFGKKGYSKIAQNLMENTHFFKNALQKIGYDVVCEPELNIVAFNHPQTEAHQLAEKLDKLGWKVSVAKCPVAIRVVLMNHIKKSHLKKLLEDLEKIY